MDSDNDNDADDNDDDNGNAEIQSMNQISTSHFGNSAGFIKL
jgi:hypothetical protein